MGQSSIFDRALRSVTAVLAIVCSVQAAAANLVAVDVMDTTHGSCRVMLTIRGQIDRVETIRLDGGRFVFDLVDVAWDGPTRRVSPDCAGIREYRFAQFSSDPMVARFVVEVADGWSCAHESVAGGLVVSCSSPATGEVPRPPADPSAIAVVRSIEFVSPIARLDAEGLVDRSIGFTPPDIVKDGLPSFGSMRDDWIGAPRPHMGLDIYIDNTPVRAVAEGTVVGVGDGDRAGGWVTIDHGRGVETVYVHISRLAVTNGEAVAKGQRIAAVDGAVGNAVEPQLHLEVRLDGRAVDPMPYIFELASEEVRAKITAANERLAELELERASRVRQETVANPD